jgi:L-arabinonolactonase
VAFDAQGQEVQRVLVPARHTTCPAFGGAGLAQLFVSSARTGMSPEALSAQPTAGGVFVATGPGQGWRGLPERRFDSSAAG